MGGLAAVRLRVFEAEPVEGKRGKMITRPLRVRNEGFQLTLTRLESLKMSRRSLLMQARLLPGSSTSQRICVAPEGARRGEESREPKRDDTPTPSSM